MNLHSKKMTALDDAYISHVSRAYIFFTFFLSHRIGPPFSRARDKSRIGDLSVLADHSNVQDRTGGKLSVSAGLQPVNGWHSICSRGF